MKVLVVGASGAIGSRFVSRLIHAGQGVIGTHTSPGSGAGTPKGDADEAASH
jgi:nucleoside-diphosphate-sugar epimerase